MSYDSPRGRRTGNQNRNQDIATMSNDPMAHLRAKLNALGEIMTRLSKDGTTLAPERATAGESSRRTRRPSPVKTKTKAPSPSEAPPQTTEPIAGVAPPR